MHHVYAGRYRRATRIRPMPDAAPISGRHMVVDEYLYALTGDVEDFDPHRTCFRQLVRDRRRAAEWIRIDGIK